MNNNLPPEMGAGNGLTTSSRGLAAASMQALHQKDRETKLNWSNFGRAPEWRNWQTRQTQNLVPARAWRFKSSLRYFSLLMADCGPIWACRAALFFATRESRAKPAVFRADLPWRQREEVVKDRGLHLPVAAGRVVVFAPASRWETGGTARSEQADACVRDRIAR